jgi:hypothetical protein
LRYGKIERRLRNGGFIAWGDPERAASAVMINEAST